ncbi:hypothetical protein D3C73_1077450 [compost metagenome]
MPLISARSPPIRTCTNSLVISVEPNVAICTTSCGSVKRISARSGIGLTATIGTPRLRASTRLLIIRGELVPVFWPITKIASACSKSSSTMVPLPTPITGGRPRLVGSWHMFEQSGKLLVPNSRTKIEYRNAASLGVRPEV